MRKFCSLLALCLCAVLPIHAQGFDDLKKTSVGILNTELQSLLRDNDVKGVTRYLKSNPDAVKDGTNTSTNEKGGRVVVPVFYDAVERTLKGESTEQMCETLLNLGCDIYSSCNGKTPVYLVMDYLAETPSEKAGTALSLLRLFLQRDDFDINRRYRSLPPPFSYLLSSNFSFLGGKYSKDYLSTELIRTIIESGGRLNTYDENGASLLLLANETDNDYLTNYLLDNGVNINKKANSSGDDAIFAAIKDNDIDRLEKIFSNYGLHMLATSFRDILSETSAEMYSFLASHCASNASSYEELVDFRGIFADSKELVRSKYESMAKQEVNEADSYDAIDRCAQRFPDMMSLIAPKRRKIASADINKIHNINDLKDFERKYPQERDLCLPIKNSFYSNASQILRSDYEKAKEELENQNLSLTGYSPASFISDFSGFYDPDKLLPLAKALDKYYCAVDVILHDAGQFYGDEETIKDQFEYNLRRIDLSSEIDNCRKFGLYSEWFKGKIDDSIKKMRETKDKMLQDLALINSMTIRDLPRAFTNIQKKDCWVNFDDFRFVVTDYSDIELDYVHFVVHGFDGGLLPDFVQGYCSLEQAIIAGYCAGKYGLSRTTGRPGYSGGLLNSFLDKEKMKLDIINAKDVDKGIKALESWFK